jgi:hypothetical protein
MGLLGYGIIAGFKRQILCWHRGESQESVVDYDMWWNGMRTGGCMDVWVVFLHKKRQET